MAELIKGVRSDIFAMDQVIYVASPYSDVSSEVMDERYEKIVSVTKCLMALRLNVISPIVHCHNLIIDDKINVYLPFDFEYWKSYNFSVLSVCGSLLVVKIDGWEKSIGVNGEIEFANEAGKEVKYITEDEVSELVVFKNKLIEK